MPCQLMVGFFAYAKSLEIHVDKKELEGNCYCQECHADSSPFMQQPTISPIFHVTVCFL
jgi:NADH pyrophosphatase NudC (nudix superfamily)